MKMDSAQKISAITGKPVEEIRKRMKEDRPYAKATFKVYQMLRKKGMANVEVVIRTSAFISLLLNDLPMELRLLILESVAEVSLTGKSDEFLEMIKRFDDKNGISKDKVSDIKHEKNR